MSREEKPNASAPTAGVDGVLRRPDGSVDIAAYSKIAQRERAEALVSSANETIRMLRGMASAIRTRLAPVARSEPASGKHGASAAK
ncbi:hypothetical protein [Bradyrhizobium sp.]|uniref:hypothetical protein n=1 Tax=Bradyrhizobium sp. TaxID=376 RepID=UPI0025C103E2|nr:hypothetical protein [Bradyrhizobium sp.]